jgi:hypothetical protein
LPKRRVYHPTRKAPRRHWYSRKHRRHGKPKIPLEVAAAGIAIPFTPPRTGWNSLVGCAQAGDWNGFGMDLAMGFIGFDPSTGQIDLWGAINPLNFESARYTKMLIAGGLIHKVRKMLVKVPMNKVPIIGNHIS